MFDGMPDQFYQFLAAASRANTTTSTSTTTTSLPLPLSFSLHHHHHHHHPSSNFPTSCFDVDVHQQASLLSPPPHLLLHHNPQLPLHHNHKHHKQETSVDDVNVVRPELELIDHDHDPWSNDEVLALLRIRSSMDNNTWFPDFTTWDNVSRKLAEVGFKRSAEKCKEKFEEESRSFNSSFISNNTNNNKNNNNNNVSNITNNIRLFGELEEVYNDHHQQSPPHSPPPPEPEPEPEPDPVLEEEEQELQEDKREEEERLEDKRNNKDEVMRSEDSEKTEENTKKVQRKRKRSSQNKFEMFKGFCEIIVNKMMAQQEKLHSKILEDMVKRDEEKIAKEEAWKKQEIERLHKEMEVRAHEQAIAGDRQAKILEFLNKFMNSNYLEVQSLGEAIENLIKVPNSISNSSILTTCTPTTQHELQNPSCISLVVTQKCSSSSPNNENLAPKSPTTRVDNSKSTLPISSSSTDQPSSQNPTNPLSSNSAAENNDTLFKLVSVSGSDIHTSTNAADPISMEFRSPDSSTKAANHRVGVENSIRISGSRRGGGGGGKDDIGRRWPRDEVLALINIRCNLFNNNVDPQHDKLEGSTKGPLWERISQKMMELGYKRTAKRCKEKWENINKYFRKTKDLNKKRSIDSRTCPYFHQLSHLYNQTTTSGVQGGGSSTSNDGTTTTTTTMHNITSDQGNEGVVQAPSFDFEF